MASSGTQPQQRIVAVTGVPPQTSDAQLEAYFQDKRIGGGDILVPIKRTGSTAYITFKDPSVAGRLVATTHVFGPARAQLGVSLFNEFSKPAQSSPTLAATSTSSPGLSSSVSNDLNSVSSTTGDAALSNSSNVSEDRIRLKVSGIAPGISKKHLELYFKKQAGGVAPDVEYEVNSPIAYLVFRSQEAANKVLAADNAVNRQPVTVTAEDVQTSCKNVAANEGVTIIVSNIPEGISKRHIELYFKKQAGGVQPDVDYDTDGRVARLRFNDIEVAMRVIGQSNALNKVPVTVVLEQQPPNVNKSSQAAVASSRNIERASGNAAVVLVTDICPDVTKTHLELYFKKQAGVAPAVQYDTKMQTAQLTFPSLEAAQRVLGQEHKLNKVPVKVTLLEEAKSGNVNAIEVVGVEPKDEELVLFYFMDFGFVDAFRYLQSDKKLLLRFNEARVAEAVLRRMTHDIVSGSLQVAVAPLKSDHVFEDDTSAAHESATVLVTGIPPGVHEKHVQLYFKSACLSGGGEVSNLVYSSGSGTAQITFACSSVARRVCALGNHKINNAALSVTPMYGNISNAWEDLTRLSVTDCRSCAVMVENIPSSVIEDHLRLYFSDYQHSGGGPIRRIYYNKKSGVAIIVFHSAEVAKRFSSNDKKFRLNGETLRVECLQSDADCTEQVLYVGGLMGLHEVRESLWWWLSAAAGTPPQELHFNADDSAGLAVFKSYVAHTVIPFSCFYNLGGRLLEIRRVNETKTLYISNLSDDTMNAISLKYYFEHPRNGGVTDCVQRVEAMKGNAYKINLTSPNVLRNIIKECQGKADNNFKLLPYYEEFSQMSEQQQFRSQDGSVGGIDGGAPPLLILEGFSSSSDEPSVIDFYESLKEDDKGNAATVHFENGELRAQLTIAKVASRIIQKSEQQSLQFFGAPISAKFRQQRLTTDTKRNMLLVRNTSGVQADRLQYFLWALSGVPVVEMAEITDNCQRSCILVKFARALTFTDDGALPWLPANLGGAPFDVELVPKPLCVFASNMPNEATDEYISLLFANSGSKMIGSIDVPNGGKIIEFSSSQDVDRVLKQRIFYDNTVELNMVAYYQPPA